MRALATMMAAATAFGWVDDLSREEQELHERWRAIKVRAAPVDAA
jgi:hypothetical protein